MKRLFIIASIATSLLANGQVINVATSNELQTALNTAKPGHIITLKANTIFSITKCTNCITNKGSGFKVPIGVNGTKNNPIKLVGPKSSVITSEDITSKYGLHLQGNNYWVIEGFTVTKSSKCVMLDSSSHNIVNNLRITQSGDEALHLRKFSSYNTVSNCYIDSTGMNPSAAQSGYAEGIYVGTANSNWINNSNNQVDTCNYNILTGNIFGSLIRSENIDIKEGTIGGEISNNVFNGLGCNGNNSADKYVDIKGDYYTIKCNTGQGNSISILNGFEVNINKITTKNGLVVNKNFGDYNIFVNNTLDMTGTTGHAIFVNSYSGVIHNTVCSNNTVINATSGLCNLPTTNCIVTSCGVLTNVTPTETIDKENTTISPNPFSDKLEITSFDNSISKIELYDLQGDMVFNEKINKDMAHQLNTSSISKGTYLLKIYFINGKIEVKKVVRL